MEWTRPSEIMQKALKIAIGELGVSEQPPGSNRGPRVEEYLASVGLGPGYAWCAAFITWCIRAASAELNIHTDLPRSGYTPNYLRAPGCQVLSTLPVEIAPGLLFLLFYPRLGRVGHIGFIEGPHPSQPDRVLTIEGNSNDDGAREGYEVCRRSRRIADLHAIITY